MEIQRYDIRPQGWWMFDSSAGEFYKVAEVDPVIAKLKAENEKLREENKELKKKI